MSTPLTNRVDDAVEVLAPRFSTEDFLAFVRRDASVPNGATGSLEPFANPRMEALQAVSAAFLAHPLLRADPASVAVAYWMRRSQLERARADYERRLTMETEVVRVPVGRVFHVAPANVDTLFLYSWALSFLCGNANVLRLSGQRPPIVDAMLEALAATAREHDILRGSDWFVTYPHDGATTAMLSAWCTHRVIWGGDETVATIRSIPLSSHASERAFGSKFSYSILAASRWLGATSAERAEVAKAFFNDVFWFDQMACASPQVLFWIGAAKVVTMAIDSFETALQEEANRRGFASSTSSAVHRRDYAFELAADADVEIDLDHPAFVGVRMLDASALRREVCGGGLLRHVGLERVADLPTFARESDQTVTHFGLEPDELEILARELGRRGVDRIVPVGEALAFDSVWDGFDLVDDFTRRVRLRRARSLQAGSTSGA